MIDTARPERVVAETIKTLGQILADKLGYTENVSAWFPMAVVVYQDPNEPPKKKPHRRPKYVQGPKHRMLAVQPRCLFISHEDYTVWITVDSSYANWYVHGEGDTRQLEYVLQELWKDGPWTIIHGPWIEDASKRTAMTRAKWDSSTGSTRSTLHPDDLEMSRVTSTPNSSKKTPTFGDLSSMGKPSRRKT